MSVHFPDCAVPALFASSNLGIPVILDFRAPSDFLSSFISLNFESARSSSWIPVFRAFLMKFFGGSNFEPKSWDFEVHSDLTWLENVGFSRVALTKMLNVFLTCWGFSLIFFAMSSMIPLATRDATWSTWFPPLVVQIPFTKDTCSIPFSAGPIHTDHLSDTTEHTFSTPSCIFA